MVELRDIYDIETIRKETQDELNAMAFGMHIGSAYLELIDVREADDEELLEIAQSVGIRIKDYKK